MASGGRRGGAGERVLESRHVIGLFMLMLLFSGVFFTLGYVMGRNQYDGQVRAASNPRTLQPTPVAPKSDPSAKSSNQVRRDSDPATESPQTNSDWSFYNAGKSAPADDNLKSGWSIPPASSARTIATSAKARNGKSTGAPAIPANSYTLQVAAMRREADAMSLASHLQKKRFPAFVTSPQGDKYYRVQVGPYGDQKSADAARKGLEGAGFKAIVKH
jgi:septal ring-binding cell division protein DamX